MRLTLELNEARAIKQYSLIMWENLLSKEVKTEGKGFQVFEVTASEYDEVQEALDWLDEMGYIE